MARHFNKHKKINEHKRRLKNKVAMQLSKHKFKIAQAKKNMLSISRKGNYQIMNICCYLEV